MKKIRTRKELENLTIKQINDLISAKKALERAEMAIRMYQRDLKKINKERALLQNRQEQLLRNDIVNAEMLHEFDEIHCRNLENIEPGKDN